jgi:hypothetical protein
MVYEYEVLMHAGHAGGILLSKGIQGWELVSVVAGGFDKDNRHHALAHTLYLRRPLIVEADDESPPRMAPSKRTAKAG